MLMVNSDTLATEVVGMCALVACSLRKYSNPSTSLFVSIFSNSFIGMGGSGLEFSLGDLRSGHWAVLFVVGVDKFSL
uniref:Uncharacterized protein n=1 Tax=Ditylenchus dipsaci TaxID=166011 RepID=A0A915E9G9_9BILA